MRISEYKKNNSSEQQAGFNGYQELAQQIAELKETVSQLESRLSTYKNTSEVAFMNRILSRIKQLIKQFEAITPNQYDIYSMECLGLCI